MLNITDALRGASHWLERVAKGISATQTLRETPPRVAVNHCGVVDILVLDVSGSMASEDYKPSRLSGACRAAASFIEQVIQANPRSAVGIVSFSAKARLVSPPLEAQANEQILKGALRSLRPKTTTNAGEGLRFADQEIRRLSNSARARILLLTDGYANKGPNPEGVAADIKKRGVQLDIVGIGGSPKDVNEEQLRKMASVVDGELHYWFIDSVGELVRKFEALALREIR